MKRCAASAYCPRSMLSFPNWNCTSISATVVCVAMTFRSPRPATTPPVAEMAITTASTQVMIPPSRTIGEASSRAIRERRDRDRALGGGLDSVEGG
jgi:hypothetical protein